MMPKCCERCRFSQNVEYMYVEEMKLSALCKKLITKFCRKNSIREKHVEESGDVRETRRSETPGFSIHAQAYENSNCIVLVYILPLYFI